MANEIWQEEELKFLQAIKDVKIPNSVLDDVAYVSPKTSSDLDVISNGGGCYWIWTTEPVLHTLHKNKPPDRFEGGEVIYNGIAKDDVKSRVKHHLFGHIDATWSGVSLDLYFGNTVSHRKKAMSVRGKVPFIITKKVISRANKSKSIMKGQEIEEFKGIKSRDDLFKIYLSDVEKDRLNNESFSSVYFRNGIDITEEKHSKFEFRVYYITGLSSLYLEFIEKKWRDINGLPKLCSYSSGR